MIYWLKMRSNTEIKMLIPLHSQISGSLCKTQFKKFNSCFLSLQQATGSFTYILYKCHLEAEWDRAGGPEGLLQSLTKLAYEK